MAGGGEQCKRGGVFVGSLVIVIVVALLVEIIAGKVAKSRKLD